MAEGDGQAEVAAEHWGELPDGCPPEAARPWPGRYFRMLDGSDEDWKSHRMQRGSDWVDRQVERGKGDHCQWNGLSIFDTFEDAESARTFFPRFENKKVRSFRMTADMGVVMKTNGPGHFTWWPHLSNFVPPPDTEEAP